MSKDYSLVETIADKKWDEFIRDSENATIFSNSIYLKNCGANYKLFFCYKKEELRAAVAVVESIDSKSIILDDLIIYNGIMYNKPTNKQNHAQQFSEQFKIQDFIANELTKMYDSIELSLHPSIVDIRAILWINYGTDLKKYTPDIRYTSYINISDFKDSKKLEDISIYNKSSTSRRQQIRYAIKKNYVTKVIMDTEQLVEFYKKTMARQGLEVYEETVRKMKNLSSALIEANIAKIYGSYDENNELGSMALFAWDNKRAYYIFGANDPEKRNGHTGTSVLWDAFYDLNKNGIDEIDLEGINSPHRGWFKLSFGGEIIPYYEISFGE